MIITCCCCTFRRPRQVGHIIAMFLKQTHQDRRLFILDDGCVDDCVIEYTDLNVHIVRLRMRFKSLGLKRNAACRMALQCWLDTEAICPWDDDDYFLPHHLYSMNAALENSDWSLPSEVLYRNDDGTFRRHLTGPGKFFHSGHGYRIDALLRANPHDDGFLEPYPDHLSGPEDQGLFRRLEATDATICDPITLTGLPPSYCYGSNDGLLHISGLLKDCQDTGADAYAKIGEQSCEPQEIIIEPPPGIELDCPIILPEILPRPF